jgi:predicted dehydrogenase
MIPSKKMNRRQFLAAAGTGAALTCLPKRALAGRVSANEKVNVAVIGTGGMGGRHVTALAENDQCEIVALCDVAMSRFHGNLDKVEKMTGKRPKGYQDFRHVLDSKDVDAIFIATPDHWHPLLSILGCEAGKDVYVEKPVCPTVEEGRAMVAAARRYGRIVQAGTQQRSMPVFQKAIDIVRGGGIGKVTSAGAWVGVNGWNVGETLKPVPRGLDWDMWLGPAPYVPFCMERFGGFMGWHDYARGGELTNWGVHLMDIVHWGIGQDQPLSVQAIGGSYRQGPGADNYENIEAIFEFEGCNVSWEQRHKNTHGGKGYGVRFEGTDGAVMVDRGTFIVRHSKNDQEWIGEPEKSWANDDHHNNFFDCIRSRKRPAAEIEQGFRSTATVLLAGIALKEGRKLNWDGAKEEFINDPQANRHLRRAYRAPWRL